MPASPFSTRRAQARLQAWIAAAAKNHATMEMERLLRPGLHTPVTSNATAMRSSPTAVPIIGVRIRSHR